MIANAMTAEIRTSCVLVDERKIRWRMNALVVGSVLILAFFVGLISGYRKPVQAVTPPDDLAIVGEVIDDRLFPQGLALSRVGANVTLNRQDADVLSFFSKRPVADILNEQVRIWKERGIESSGLVSPTRGAVVGQDRQGRRYSLTVWQIPPTLKKGELKEYFCQGLATRFFTPQALENAAVFNAELGVPVRDGAKGGVVFASHDPAGKSLTTTYINPGDLQDNRFYYRDLLASHGWTLVEGQDWGADLGMARDEYYNREARLTVLLTDNSALGGKPTSAVNITKVYQ